MCLKFGSASQANFLMQSICLLLQMSLISSQEGYVLKIALWPIQILKTHTIPHGHRSPLNSTLRYGTWRDKWL
ncbi:hypothetical protein DFH27DRAFT_35568 [Peziza echinospora]|nr:hypothetical protein DFH27DRAFT_35568 [Peziza echinospora]